MRPNYTSVIQPRLNMAALGVFSYPLAALVSDLSFLGLVVMFLFVALAVTLYALVENGRQRGLPSTLVLAALVVTRDRRTSWSI